MRFWINHPRSKMPDSMLTLAVLATLTCLTKLLLNGVVITIHGHSFNCGTIDGGLIAATLAPTLTAYVARKQKDSPDRHIVPASTGSTHANS